MEKDTDKAILIVGISNPNRLNAVETEDFFLVNTKDYIKAVRVLKAREESDNIGDIVDSTSGIIQVLVSNGIDFERIVEGRRFFFNTEVAPDHESDIG